MGEVKKVNCPACGGPIDLRGAQARCPFCGTVVVSSEPEPPPTPGPVVIEIPNVPSSLARRKTGCAGTLAVAGAVVLLAAVGLVVFFLTQNESPGTLLSPLRRSVQGTPVVVPADRTGPADLLLCTYDYGSSDPQRYLTYLDGLDHTLRWDSPALGNSAFLNQPVVGPTLVYLTDDSRLLALSRSDGQPAWQATLSDKIEHICQDCLLLAGKHLVVLTADGVLQGFDSASGQALWSRRLATTPRNLWLLAGEVAVLDEPAGGPVALYLYDPASGEPVRTITPRCTRPGGRDLELFSIYSANVLAGPAGDTVYFFFDLTPGCAQRWDAASGTLVWQVVAEEHHFDRFEGTLFLADGTIYGGYRGYLQGRAGGIVLAVDAADGTVRVLAWAEDYDLTPLARHEGTVIVSAKRTRGSERYELWGLDAVTGERKWEKVFQDEEPIEAPGSWAGNAYSWRLTPRALVLLHMLEEPSRLVLETLDPRTGQSAGLTDIDLGDDSWNWDGVVWTDDTAWVVASKLHAVDLLSGKLLYTWP